MVIWCSQLKGQDLEKILLLHIILKKKIYSTQKKCICRYYNFFWLGCFFNDFFNELLNFKFKFKLLYVVYSHVFSKVWYNLFWSMILIFFFFPWIKCTYFIVITNYTTHHLCIFIIHLLIIIHKKIIFYWTYIIKFPKSYLCM